MPGDDDATARPLAVAIEAGYRTGLIGSVTLLHAEAYARIAGFGQAFESMVASGLAEFCGRLGDPRNQIWTAVRDGAVMGSVALDGESLGPGLARLRWFLLAEPLRGAGVGRSLLRAALAHADAAGCRETRLDTFAGLDAARRLYEAHGFRCVAEVPGRHWGPEVLEQHFVRPHPSACAGSG